MPNFGSQTIKIYIVSGDTLIQHPLLPQQELLYYDNYLIEMNLAIKQVTTDKGTSNEHTTISYDTVFYFINQNAGTCVKYNKFAESAVAQSRFKLSEKKSGISFNSDTDSSNYPQRSELKDTLLDRKNYKYFKTAKNPPSKEESIFYLDFNAPLAPFHFSKKMDDMYKAMLVRMDVKRDETNEYYSFQMTIKPGNLSEKQLAVFKSWIRSN